MKNKDGSTTTDLEETEKEHSNKVYLCPHITSQVWFHTGDSADLVEISNSFACSFHLSCTPVEVT